MMVEARLKGYQDCVSIAIRQDAKAHGSFVRNGSKPTAAHAPSVCRRRKADQVFSVPSGGQIGQACLAAHPGG